MLLLTNEDIDGLVSMRDCVDAVRDAYALLAAGDAAELPRQDGIDASTARDDAVYSLKAMGATIGARGVGVVRINSDAISAPVVDGVPRRHRLVDPSHGRYNGAILLFSAAYGQLLAIMNDGLLSGMRVGASSGVAADLLARDDARILGVLGAGQQAEAHIEAMAVVRDLERVRVYSPSAASREGLARRLSERLGLDVVPVDHPAAAVDGVDIVVTATSSLAPTIEPAWIRPGMHLACVRVTEVPPSLVASFDRVVVNSHQAVAQHFTDEGRARSPGGGAPSPMTNDRVALDTYPTLAQVVAAGTPVRLGADETTCFYNIQGLGIQFAAVARLVHERAVARGIGTDVDDALMLQSLHP